MALGNLDLADREHTGPLDMLAAVQQIMDAHTPEWRESGWVGDWVCQACNAHLSDDEVRTHTAHQLWTRGYLNG